MRLLFLSLLLRLDSSLPYSLRNCSVRFSGFVPGRSVTCSERRLADVPADIPKDATSVNLSTNHIGSIGASAFRGFLQLQVLQLQLNSLRLIADGAFCDLAALTDLDLSSNQLTVLNAGTFQGLSKLRRLCLNENRLAWVSPPAFRPLVSLRALNLSANDLHQPSHMAPILQLPNLLALEAGGNRFTALDSDDLPFNYSGLRTFEFSMRSLSRISIRRDVFPLLRSLRLSDCGAGFQWDVPSAFLRSLTSLSLRGTAASLQTYRMILRSAESVELLRLSHMREYFDRGLIAASCRILPALRRLDLTHNQLDVLGDSLFESCSGITELVLVGNALTDLSVASLKPLNRLLTLKSGGNLLSRVPLAVRGLATLAVLQLSDNDIAELGCSDFLNLTRLTWLSLRNNRISNLKVCAFQDLKNLRVLLLQSNLMKQVSEPFGVSLHNLRVLDVHYSVFSNVSVGTFRALSSLVSLNVESLSDCVLFNGTFEGLDRLRFLTVSAESLRPDMLRGLTRLHSLTLSFPSPEKSLSPRSEAELPVLNVPSLRKLTIRNRDRGDPASPHLLQDLNRLEFFAAEGFFTGTPHKDTFTHTPGLTRLRIVSSDVLNLKPELFQPIPNLQALDLSNNGLRSLDFLSRVNLSALSSLILVKNQLTVISEAVFQSLPALTYLDLTGNPFTCDCSNAGFIQWVKSSRTQVVGGHQYDCDFPAAQRGRKLLDFDVQSCWTDFGFLCFVSSSCVTLLALLTAFTYHFLRWQLAYTFQLFLAFLYDSRKRKKGAAHLYDAFISYNVHDEAWVYREMLPVLEGEQGWRLCLHHRDFLPGKPIMENITDAIYSSRKTICVISRRYLQSEWCSREIQMASFRLFDEQKDVLILLFLEEIPAHQLSPYHRMRKLLKRRTYLSWLQAGRHAGVFWQSVRRALETGDAPSEDANLLAPSQPPN